MVNSWTSSVFFPCSPCFQGAWLAGRDSGWTNRTYSGKLRWVLAVHIMFSWFQTECDQNIVHHFTAWGWTRILGSWTPVGEDQTEQYYMDMKQRSKKKKIKELKTPVMCTGKKLQIPVWFDYYWIGVNDSQSQSWCLCVRDWYLISAADLSELCPLWLPPPELYYCETHCFTQSLFFLSYKERETCEDQDWTQHSSSGPGCSAPVLYVFVAWMNILAQWRSNDGVLQWGEHVRWSRNIFFFLKD